MPELFIGLMSGTSMDSIDAVLADFSDETPRVIATHAHPLEESLRNPLRNAIDASTPKQLGEIDHKLGHCFADAVDTLLLRSGTEPDSVRAIGSHGQTIWHQPDGTHCFTLQIGDPNIIAARTGIKTVADFRRADMAVGGQGAPLAPAFHNAVFHEAGKEIAVLNLGGIANLTLLPGGSDVPVTGFDTGPANTLLDHWYRRHHSDKHFDEAGRWAASGTVQTRLLKACLSDPWFSRPAPKSTGPEHFNLPWLEQYGPNDFSPEDVQATLAELTAISVSTALLHASPGTDKLWVCGGGAHNDFLVARLSAHMAELEILETTQTGIGPDWIEGVAFAWIARQTINGKPGNLPAVTGASRPVVLGGIYNPVPV